MILRACIISILAGISIFSHRVAKAELKGSLPMVYDPKTKKYFIGGESKFVIKQGEGSSLIDRIDVSIDGKEYQRYDGAIRFSTEGKHTLKFRAVSPVNNWAPIQFIEAFVDLSAPTSKTTFDKQQFFKNNNNTYAALNSYITLNSDDNLSGVATTEYSWDGVNFETYENPILIDKKGRQSIFVRSTDRVGNVETPVRTDFVADGTAPQSKIVIKGRVRPSRIKGENFLAASDSVAYELTSLDPVEATDNPDSSNAGESDSVSRVKSIWVSIDDKPYASYIKPIFLLQEGPHNIKYYSEDNVGNKEAPKTVRIFTVSEAPRTKALVEGKIVNTGGLNFATRTFKLKLSAADNAIGVERVEVKVDGDSEWKTYLEPIAFMSPGPHKVTYRSVDRVGNTEPTRTYNVIIQTKTPETSIETAQPVVNRNGITYSPSPNIITLNVKNSGVGVDKTMVTMNGGPWQVYDGPLTITSDKRVHKITFKSVDKLGNEEKTQSVTYHMIGSSPAVDLFVSDGGNVEEKVRTNYFEGAAREIASPQEKEKKKGKKNSKKR